MFVEIQTYTDTQVQLFTLEHMIDLVLTDIIIYTYLYQFAMESEILTRALSVLVLTNQRQEKYKKKTSKIFRGYY